MKSAVILEGYLERKQGMGARSNQSVYVQLVAEQGEPPVLQWQDGKNH